MSHIKVISPTSPLTDLLGPFPVEGVPIKVPEDEGKDMVARAVIRGHIEDGIKSTIGIALVLPPCLLDAIAENVLQLAKDEPCGLRGSVLEVKLVEERPSQEMQLVRIKADPSTPTTHTLKVTLRPDSTSWYTKMAYIFRSLAKRRLVISPKFELSKTTMYNLYE